MTPTRARASPASTPPPPSKLDADTDLDTPGRSSDHDMPTYSPSPGEDVNQTILEVPLVKQDLLGVEQSPSFPHSDESPSLITPISSLGQVTPQRAVATKTPLQRAKALFKNTKLRVIKKGKRMGFPISIKSSILSPSRVIKPLKCPAFGCNEVFNNRFAANKHFVQCQYSHQTPITTFNLKKKLTVHIVDTPSPLTSRVLSFHSPGIKDTLEFKEAESLHVDHKDRDPPFLSPGTDLSIQPSANEHEQGVNPTPPVPTFTESFPTTFKEPFPINETPKTAPSSATSTHPPDVIDSNPPVVSERKNSDVLFQSLLSEFTNDRHSSDIFSTPLGHTFPNPPTSSSPMSSSPIAPEDVEETVHTGSEETSPELTSDPPSEALSSPSTPEADEDTDNTPSEETTPKQASSNPPPEALSSPATPEVEEDAVKSPFKEAISERTSSNPPPEAQFPPSSPEVAENPVETPSEDEEAISERASSPHSGALFSASAPKIVERRVNTPSEEAISEPGTNSIENELTGLPESNSAARSEELSPRQQALPFTPDSDEDQLLPSALNSPTIAPSLSRRGSNLREPKVEECTAVCLHVVKVDALAAELQREIFDKAQIIDQCNRLEQEKNEYQNRVQDLEEVMVTEFARCRETVRERDRENGELRSTIRELQAQLRRELKRTREASKSYHKVHGLIQNLTKAANDSRLHDILSNYEEGEVSSESGDSDSENEMGSPRKKRKTSVSVRRSMERG